MHIAAVYKRLGLCHGRPAFLGCSVFGESPLFMDVPYLGVLLYSWEVLYVAEHIYSGKGKSDNARVGVCSIIMSQEYGTS